jgi:hypothetical protein
VRRTPGWSVGAVRPGWAVTSSAAPSEPRLRIEQATPPTVTGRVEVSESDFDLRVARHAMEQRLQLPEEAVPGSASDLVERILSLTGRGREDAMRAGSLVRGLWSHPLLERARGAAHARVALDVAWVERQSTMGAADVTVATGVIDLWFEDGEGQVLVLCDSGAWREAAGRRSRIEARRRDFERLTEHLPSGLESEERWILLLGGPAIEAERID